MKAGERVHEDWDLELGANISSTYTKRRDGNLSSWPSPATTAYVLRGGVPLDATTKA